MRPGEKIFMCVLFLSSRRCRTNVLQTIPATRGEVAELRHGIDALATGLHDLQTTVLDMFKTFQLNSSNSVQGSPQSGSGHQAQRGTQGPFNHFEPKLKGPPVHRTDDELILSVCVFWFH